MQTERTSKTHLSVLDFSTMAAMATWGCCHGDDGRPCLEPVKKDFSSGPASSSSSPLHLIRFPSSLAKRMTRSTSSLTSSPRNVFPVAASCAYPPCGKCCTGNPLAATRHTRMRRFVSSRSIWTLIGSDWPERQDCTTAGGGTLVASCSEPSVYCKSEPTNGKWKGSFD